MRKVLVGFLLVLFVVSLGLAAEVAPEKLSKKGGKIYSVILSDTIAVNTGNFVYVYGDTADSSGFSMGNLAGDSLFIWIAGIGDADTTAVEVKVQVASDNIHYADLLTDSLELNGTGMYGEIFKCNKVPKGQMRVKITGYGTTDNSQIVALTAWGQ